MNERPLFEELLWNGKNP